MKKLFLASFASVSLDLVNELLPKPAKELKAAFIPTAGDPYADKGFVNVDRDKLTEMGFDVTDINLTDTNEAALTTMLENIDLVLVAGGNTFYLLDQVKKSGFDKVLTKMLDRGLIYVGSSAGSVLCCPTIEGAKKFDDPNDAPDLSDYSGLDLFDKVIIPHAHKEKYAERIKQTTQEMEARGLTVITLTDDQAVTVTDEGWKVVGR
jgi:dipeptidase E